MFKKIMGIAQVRPPNVTVYVIWVYHSDVVQQALLAYVAMQFGACLNCNSVQYIAYVLFATVTRFFGSTPASKEPPPSPVASGTTTSTIIPGQTVPPVANIPAIPTQSFLDPSWPLGIPLSMHVYFNTNPKGDVFSRKWTSMYRKNGDEDLPHFVWDNITFGDWQESRTIEYDVKLPPVRDLHFPIL